MEYESREEYEQEELDETCVPGYRKRNHGWDDSDEEEWNKHVERVRRNFNQQEFLDQYEQYKKEQEKPKPEPEEEFDVKKAFLEVTAWRDKRQAEEQEMTMEEAIEQARQASFKIPMYDFGLGEMSNEQAMADFYGWKYVNRIREEIRKSYDLPNHTRETGKISTKLWQELRDIRAGRKPSATKSSKKPNPQPETRPKAKVSTSSTEPQKPKNQGSEPSKIFKRERQSGDDYFMSIERGVIRNESYRELFKGPNTVYQWLWANLVRSLWIDTNGYPIKEKYYDKGYLAYCSSYRQIARDCGLHKNKVKEYIDSFKEAGVIKVENLVPNGKKRGQSVFILGRWHLGKDENGKEKVIEDFFINDVFITKKDGQNVPN